MNYQVQVYENKKWVDIGNHFGADLAVEDALRVSIVLDMICRVVLLPRGLIIYLRDPTTESIVVDWQKYGF